MKIRKNGLWVFLVFWVMVSSCAQEEKGLLMTEDESYDQALAVEDAEGRLEALEAFLEQYPESKRRQKVLRQMLDDAIELEEEEAAISYAERFLSDIPERGRMREYNSIAWNLAEAGIALDLADQYASKAVEMARASDSPRLGGILDTWANVLYRKGQVERALEIQQEAIKGNETDAEMQASLALFHYEAGQPDPAMKGAVKALLLGASGETVTRLKEWVSEASSDSRDAAQRTEKLVQEGVDAYLAEEDTPLRLSNAARVMADLEVSLDRAESMAREALSSLEPEDSDLDQARIRIALAAVLRARGESARAFDVLKPFEAEAPLYFADYWLSLGSCYQEMGDSAAALDTLLNGVLLEENPNVMERLRGLSLTDQEIRAKVKERKQQLLDFHPGRIDPSDLETDRVVLAELFTGSECNPCQAADLAFDLLAEYYPRTALVILEHHLHIPGADPMTNRDTIARYEYHGQSFGTPTVFINGVDQVAGGGPRFLKKMAFDRYHRPIQKWHLVEPTAEISLSASLKGETVQVTADVEIPSDAPDTRLQIALVEKSVFYVGGNGIEQHAFVVRSLVNGADGIRLNGADSVARVNQSFSLEVVEKGIISYLDEFTANPPDRYAGFGGWEERPDKLDRSNLAVVVWVQDQRSGRVLQAAYAEL
ncbi:MAG: hypothetical protein JSU96_17190 [Acidobacteriota bacterium]|nr:MAG: hypothetical protein JSU96_17190 [Acidobacteriota bacterium]